MSFTKEKIVKAIDIAKKNSKKRKFNQSIELILALQDIDIKKPENRITELIALPNPPSKKVKIAVFARGDLALKATHAGSDKVFSKASLDGILNDNKKARKLISGIDFFLAEPSLMPLIGRTLGRILGPKGKMPTPVSPTAPIGKVIKKYRRTVLLRVRDQLNAQCKVGSEDMNSEDIADNIQTILNRLERQFEKGFKNISEVYVKTTMGPPIKIAL